MATLDLKWLDIDAFAIDVIGIDALDYAVSEI